MRDRTTRGATRVRMIRAKQDTDARRDLARRAYDDWRRGDRDLIEAAEYYALEPQEVIAVYRRHHPVAALVSEMRALVAIASAYLSEYLARGSRR